MEFSEENEKEHVPDDPYPELSLSDLSQNKKKSDKKKNLRKHRKDYLSDPSSNGNSDSSDDSGYRYQTTQKEERLVKGSDQIMRTFNGKAADYRV